MSKSNKKMHRAFVLPAMFVMIAIMIVPMIFAVYIMFHDVNLMENSGRFVWAGLGNFKSMIADERVKNAVFVSIKFLIGTLTLEVILGIAISAFLDRKFKFKGVIRALVIIPMFMTPVVSGLIWRAFFDANAGIISYLFKLITGKGLDMLGDVTLALWALVIVDVWQWTPFMILLIMASLDGLDEDVMEAAKIDGANELQTIFRIKIPMIKSTILMAAVIRAIDCLKAFDVIYIMTKGGPGTSTETLNMYSYVVGFNWYKIGYATAISFVFTMVITFVLGKLIRHTSL